MSVHEQHDVEGAANRDDAANEAGAVGDAGHDFRLEEELHAELGGEAAAVDPRPRQPAPPQVVPQPDEREDDPHAPDLGALATKRHVPEGSGELDAWGKGGKVKGGKVGVGSAVGIRFTHMYRMIHLFRVACQRRQKPAKE